VGVCKSIDPAVLQGWAPQTTKRSFEDFVRRWIDSVLSVIEFALAK
jgi:hypothetical protein